jgi:glycerate kinase
VDELEQGMCTYARVLERTFSGFYANAAGMGAAGGLGAAASAFLHASVLPGIEQVLDLVGFDELLAGCDLCVTGEGHADAQSAHGKVISGVAARCRAANVPCVAVVGGMNADACELLECGVDVLVPTVIDVCTLEDALAHAERNYSLAAQRLFSLLKLGIRLA